MFDMLVQFQILYCDNTVLMVQLGLGNPHLIRVILETVPTCCKNYMFF